MNNDKHDSEKIIHGFFLAFSLLLIVASFFTGPINELIPSFINILKSPQALTADACALGGLQGALLNTGLIGLIALGLMHFSGAKPTGASVGAFFLTIGFSFFGKNCLNILPIIFGVWFYSKLKKEPFSKHVNMALFAGCLSPMVSEALFNRYIIYSTPMGILLAVFLGMLIGVVMPPLSAHTATMHKGHNLFNAGLAAGFFGFLTFTLYKTCVLKPLGLESEYALQGILSPGYPIFFPIFFGIIFALTLAFGFLLNKGSFTGYKNLLSRSGHGNDFLALDGPAQTLINFGALGLMSLGYMLAVKAPFTGPTVGSMLCIVCWAANGSHLINVLPIFAGYAIVSAFAAWTLSTQAIAVGVCFATGLSPISGRWGWQWGALAGAMHSCLVTYTAGLHGGFNLYNGGFTSGLVALTLVPILETYFKEAK